MDYEIYGFIGIHVMSSPEEPQSGPSPSPGKSHKGDALKETVGLDLIRKWERIQDELRTKIIKRDEECWQLSSDFKDLKYVAGLDISYPVLDAKESDEDELERDSDSNVPSSNCNSAFAALVICSFPSMDVVYKNVEPITYDVPYIAGYLAFRESKPLVEAVQKLIKTHPEFQPNVLLVDGNGILHPQQAGLASHVGYHTNIPCIGVSKNLFHFDGLEYTKKMVQDMTSVGDYIYLRNGDKDNTIIGMALKTSQKARNPVYVSVGHKISLETSKKVVLACSKYRVPEPIRMADFLSRELIRQTIRLRH